MGYNDESKGFRIYWPKKHKVSIERDMYFDKNHTLKPDEVSIEGVEDVFTNSDTPQSQKFSDESPDAPDESKACPKSVNNTTSNPTPTIVDNVAKNLPATQNVSENSPTPPNAPIPPPHQRRA